MGNRNYYIENVREIAAICFETPDGYTWNVAVDIFDGRHPGEAEDLGGIGEQREDFYKYVAARRFDRDGNEITD